MDAEILPLAITMVAGPQILTAIVFVTSDRAISLSLALVTAVGLSTAAWVFVWSKVASAVGHKIPLHKASEPTTAGKVIPLVLAGLLVAASVKAYLGRQTSEPPKWMAKLQDAGVRQAFVLGVVLISLMPGDIVVTATTGMHLESQNRPFSHALPFVALTTLIMALPLIGYLLFRRRAVVAMPKVREWMNTNSWLVNIAVYLIFIVLILT